MTDPPTQDVPRPAPRRRPRALPTVMAALAVFGVAFEFLAFQLSAGRDPAIGGTPAAITRQASSQPVNKRIVITKVVGDNGISAPTSGATAASSAAATPAPVTTSSS